MQDSAQFRVAAEDAGRRLDEFLAARIGRLSRMRIARLIARGGCTVNGLPRQSGYHVAAGDVIDVMPGDEAAPNSMTPERVPLDVVFEDESLLVVVKPAGVLAHPTRGVKAGTLANALAYHLNRQLLTPHHVTDSPDTARAAPDLTDTAPDPSQAALESAPTRELIRPGLVHRLDRATSGLMVVAKTQRALSILTRHFHERLVEKRYVALLGGRVAAEEMLIAAPVGRDPARRPQWNVSDEGKPSSTRLRVLERGARTTLVELEPLTGRTNQLRIHCAHVGHPIVGDEWYGGAPHARLCLHAARLAFHHPRGGLWLEFDSEVPPAMACAPVV